VKSRSSVLWALFLFFGFALAGAAEGAVQPPNIEWQKSLGGSGNDRANSIQQTSDGGYIVAGYAQSTDGDVIGHHVDNGDSGYDFWIVKLNAGGGISRRNFNSNCDAGILRIHIRAEPTSQLATCRHPPVP
jgi:hypothetical protein